MDRFELWLVRHGETEWSAAGRHTGRTDVPLTAGGRDAARRLTSLLAGHDFTLVLTSPLQRARETCRLAGFGDRAEIVPDLREWDYGDDEGRTTAEIRETRPGWAVFTDGPAGGEPLVELGERADRVIARCRDAGGPVIAFSHGHMSRVIAARWIELPPAAGARFALATAALGVLGWERETAVISRWSLTAGD